MNIGEKVRTLRLSKMMTQSELAGDTITRNMLSCIENGSATPSVQTLIYLAGRLGVSAGYLLSDEEDEFFYSKAAAMPEIMSAYSDGEWKIGADLCGKIGGSDNEIYFLNAYFTFRNAVEQFTSGILRDAIAEFELAHELAEKTVYPTEWLKAEIENYLICICEIAPSLDTSVGLPDCPSCVGDTDDFCRYYRLYRLIKSGKQSKTELPAADTPLGHHLKAAASIEKKEYRSALNELRASATSEDALPLPALYFIFSDFEICCRETDDYKGAYYYSGMKTGLLEKFLSRSGRED